MHVFTLLYSSSTNQQMVYAVGFTLNKLQLFLQSSAEANEDVDTGHRSDKQSLYHALQICLRFMRTKSLQM